MAVIIPEFWQKVLNRGTGLTPEEYKVAAYMYQIGPYNELGKLFFPYDTESSRFMLPTFDSIDSSAFLHGENYQEPEKSWKLRPMLFPGEESESGGLTGFVEGIRNAGSKVTSAIGNAIDYTMQNVVGSDVMKNISELTPTIAKAALAAMTAYAGGAAVGAIDTAATAGAAGAEGITGAGAGEAMASELAASSLAEGAATGASITGSGAGEALANQLLSAGTSTEALTSRLMDLGFSQAEAAALAAETAQWETATGVASGLEGSEANTLLNLVNNTPVSTVKDAFTADNSLAPTTTVPTSVEGTGPFTVDNSLALAGTGTGVTAAATGAGAGVGAGTGATASNGFSLFSSAVPLVTSGINALVASDAARRAANTQADAAANATDAVMKQYWQNRADLAPWREAGVNALGQLVKKVNAGPGEFTKSPGYEFRLNEGTKAIERSAAARGGVLSGATTKALTRFGQDYATSDYDNFLRRYYESLTPLQSLAGVGQSTASQTAALGANAANAASQNTIAAGQAQASGDINQANALTGSINSGLNNYLLWKYMNKGV